MYSHAGASDVARHPVEARHVKPILLGALI
jgi:hypothetical protein